MPVSTTRTAREVWIGDSPLHQPDRTVIAEFQEQVIAAVNGVEAQVTSDVVWAATWSDLLAITPEIDGAGGEVLDSDTGTHGAATATGYNGGQRLNAGRYSWNAAWGRWVRIGGTGLSAKADRTELEVKVDQAELEAEETARIAADAAKLDTAQYELRFQSIPPESGYVWGLGDAFPGYFPLLVTVDGAVEIPSLTVPAEAVTLGTLATEVTALLPQALPEGSGYRWGVGDAFPGYFPILITDAGGVILNLEQLNGQVVGVSNLTDSAAAEILPNTADRVPVRPGRWRSAAAPVALTTRPRDGSCWQAFPDLPVRLLRGVNGSGQALEVRKATGLLLQGTGYAGAFDPGAYPSRYLRGQISGPSVGNPSSGAPYTDGDYYQYVNGSGAVSTGTHAGMRVGDLLVYDGGAWHIQPAPGTFGARDEGDWWRVTGFGRFEGIRVSPGDAIVYHGRQTGGGGWQYERWMQAAGLVYRGEFSPGSGLPAAPVDGEVYQADSPGTATFTFAAGDMLLREDGAWIHVPTEPIATCGDGASMALRCAASADEWEVRRADKSAAIVGLTLRADQERSQRAPTRNIRVIGDSMPGQAQLFENLSAEFPGRTVVEQSYGGSTSRQVRGMIDYAITNGDLYAGDTLFMWHGQNNQPPSVGSSNWSQIIEATLQVSAMAGARDLRFAPMGICGQRNFTEYTGGRLICPQQEDQFDGSSVLAALHAEYDRMFGGRWFNVWAILQAAAVGDAEMQAEPSVHFPGKTEAEVAEAYGILPLSWFKDSTLPMDAGDMTFRGTRTGAALPTGGADGDYYIRTDGSSQTDLGSLAIRVGGVWQWFSWDRTHLNATGGARLAAAMAQSLTEWSW
ncbi:hypothetical protein [Marinibacterium profundimaris]|uniref:Uncharacterized protein n=1 Tax=Marinibacterium profundimaris TaxID=1679460 RepID=A0A225NZV5_9RHOB|nr:hypothetical protein [Marinibacterium profundimaris]OWU77596.1 hypothetical protein ATO3_02595 [Marinibacterium profundimaris]